MIIFSKMMIIIIKICLLIKIEEDGILIDFQMDDEEVITN